MAGKLRQLSLEELCQLTTTVGIEFSIGNNLITDKEEFIGVLDEADQGELKKAYQQILQSNETSRSPHSQDRT
jgi:hypothetical protein